MAITKNPDRQQALVAYVDVNFSDLTGQSGVDVAAIELPQGSVILGGDVTVITPFNSATSDVLDVGDAGSQNRYLNDANIHAAGRTALVPTGYIHLGGSLTVRWVGVGAVPTAGKVRLAVEYYQIGRSCETYD